MKTTIITDASWCPYQNVGGWAAWITITIDETKTTRRKVFGKFKEFCLDSGTAELRAAINGLWVARKLGATEVLLQSDCLEALNRIKKIHPDIEVRHVKGHTKIKSPRYFVNRWCDTAAKRMMRDARRSSHNQRYLSYNYET